MNTYILILIQAITFFACNQNKVSYSSIECIKNGMITNTKYETGFKVFNPPHVVVFSNFPPDEEKLSADRWNIKEIC
jgi:hypothetical protein